MARQPEEVEVWEFVEWMQGNVECYSHREIAKSGMDFIAALRDSWLIQGKVIEAAQKVRNTVQGLDDKEHVDANCPRCRRALSKRVAALDAALEPFEGSQPRENKSAQERIVEAARRFIDTESDMDKWELRAALRHETEPPPDKCEGLP